MVTNPPFNGAAFPYHLSLSFTWYDFSKSPFPLLHLVRLFWENLSRVRPLQITFLFSSLDAASPYHISHSFTWYGCCGKISQGCGCSRSPFFFPSLSATSLDRLSPSFTWCDCSRKISLGCGRSRSPFSFLHLLRLLQIIFPFPSLGAAVLGKSLKGAAILDHLSLSFT